MSERPRDVLWDAFVAELGEPESRSERGRRNAALKELREIGATPDALRARCKAHRRLWPDCALTATSIAANWTLLGREAVKGPRFAYQCPYCSVSCATADDLEAHVYDHTVIVAPPPGAIIAPDGG